MYKREDPLEADNTKNTKSILNWWHKVPDDYFIEKDEFLIYENIQIENLFSDKIQSLVNLPIF